MAFEQAESNESDLVLVTGATGFLASHIIKALLEKNYRVRGTVRDLKNKKVEKIRNLFDDKIELVKADLLEENSWENAVMGCRYVLHTASPFPLCLPSDEDELVRPAFKGTLNVLKACLDCQVKRVVLTSSCCSMYGDKFTENRVYTEKDWPYFRRLKPYSKSKVVAERAAWEFVKERSERNLPCFELAVINPGLILVIHFKPTLNLCINFSELKLLNCFKGTTFIRMRKHVNMGN